MMKNNKNIVLIDTQLLKLLSKSNSCGDCREKVEKTDLLITPAAILEYTGLAGNPLKKLLDKIKEKIDWKKNIENTTSQGFAFYAQIFSLYQDRISKNNKLKNAIRERIKNSCDHLYNKSCIYNCLYPQLSKFLTDTSYFNSFYPLLSTILAFDEALKFKCLTATADETNEPVEEYLFRSYLYFLRDGIHLQTRKGKLLIPFRGISANIKFMANYYKNNQKRKGTLAEPFKSLISSMDNCYNTHWGKLPINTWLSEMKASNIEINEKELLDCEIAYLPVTGIHKDGEHRPVICYTMEKLSTIKRRLSWTQIIVETIEKTFNEPIPRKQGGVKIFNNELKQIDEFLLE